MATRSGKGSLKPKVIMIRQRAAVRLGAIRCGMAKSTVVAQFKRNTSRNVHRCENAQIFCKPKQSMK